MQNLGNIGVMGLVCSGKTLASGQTAENKRPRFSASRGWGQNLENIWVSSVPLLLSAGGSVWEPPARGRIGRTQRVSGAGDAPAVRLSKIEDYLADNFCLLMLSEVTSWVQEERERLGARFPNWESPRIKPAELDRPSFDRW